MVHTLPGTELIGIPDAMSLVAWALVGSVSSRAKGDGVIGKVQPAYAACKIASTVIARRR